jgi:hypothetical protein
MTLDFHKYEKKPHLSSIFDSKLTEYIVKNREEIVAKFSYINSYSESFIFLYNRKISITPVFKLFAKLNYYRITENGICIGKIKSASLFSKPSITLNTKKARFYKKKTKNNFWNNTQKSFHLEISNADELIHYNFEIVNLNENNPNFEINKSMIGTIKLGISHNTLLATIGLFQLELMLLAGPNSKRLD